MFGKIFAQGKAAFNRLFHLVTTGGGSQREVAKLACLIVTVADLTFAIS